MRSLSPPVKPIFAWRHSPTVTTRWRSGWVAVAVALVASVASVSLPASLVGAAPDRADPASEAKRLANERERVRTRRASKASQINVLEADDAKVSAALTDLNQNVGVYANVIRPGSVRVGAAVTLRS